MPKIPRSIRRACTSSETTVTAGTDGISVSTSRKVIDTQCVSDMMSERRK